MFGNYFKILFRSVRKQKMYTFLNVLGLTTGLTCFILISLFVHYEYSYDNFHVKKDRIFTVYFQNADNFYHGSNKFGVTQAPMAQALMNEFPEVETATVLDDYSSILFEYEGNLNNESGIFVWDNFFDVFTFPLLSGDPETVLEDPFSIILTEKLSKKYFGDEDPVGKTVILRENTQFTVTGIVKDVPANSQIQFGFIAPFMTCMKEFNNNPDAMTNWGNSSYYTFALLREGTSHMELDKKLSLISTKYELSDKNKYNKDRIRRKAYHLLPLEDIHLTSGVNFYLGTTTDKKTLLLFSVISVFILLIACINFMNLSTAQSSSRAKEIGVRKVVGAQKGQLVRQFIGESVLYSAVSFLLSICLSAMLIGSYSILIGKTLHAGMLFESTYLLQTGMAVLAAGLFSGSYPAFFLSSYRPVQVLKGRLAKKGKASAIRPVLVVVQFCISIILIVGTITVFKQLQYMRSKNLGYDREHIVYLRMQDKHIRDQADVVKEKLLSHASVAGVSRANFLPTMVRSSTTIKYLDDGGEEKKMKTYVGQVDYDYLKLFNIELVSGRNFSREFPTDKDEAVIINESAARQAGWNEPVGHDFGFWQADKGKIIGIVKDFHCFDLHLNAMPLAISMNSEYSRYLIMKINPGNIPAALSEIESIYKEFKPRHPFKINFLDDTFNRMYASEQKLGTIFGYFSSLAVLIACLGLFGLSTYTAERKTIEIGIRKTLGATVANIVLNLSKEFTRYVIIANILALPAAFFIMNVWLNNFANRTSLGIGVLSLTAFASLAIALITVGYQSVRAAYVNPVNALKQE